MNMSLAAAALAADVNKTTLLIIRAIKGGKVGRGRDKHGPWRIAPAEIHRVHPSAPQWSAPDAPQRDAMATLEAQIAGLREVADLLRAQLDETRRDRDKWADATSAALRALPPPAESLPTRSRKDGGAVAGHRSDPSRRNVRYSRHEIAASTSTRLPISAHGAHGVRSCESTQRAASSTASLAAIAKKVPVITLRKSSLDAL